MTTEMVNFELLNMNFFSVQIGAFLAPVVAIPFLGHDNNATQILNNSTDEKLPANIENDTQITILYPLVGLCVVIMSFGYLIMAIQNCKQTSLKSDEESKQQNKVDADNQLMTKNQWILLVIMLFFFFFYVGSEVSYGVYLTAFSVESSLKLSKQIGSQITGHSL